ncbi:NADH-quinone oxidoreductase subunit A [Mucilaginibacter sp. AW1-3]
MDEVGQISEFGKILIFLIAGFIMVGLTFFLSSLIAPNKPNPEKLMSYECGEEPEGNSWMPFNPKFYVIALIFLVFDVEMVFIFPWATVFGNHQLIKIEPLWGWFSLAEMFIFIGILILGLVYVWVKGDLDWIKAKPIVPTTDIKIPQSLYDKVNQQQSAYQVKTFSLETAEATVATAGATAAPSAPAAAPAMRFKPAFKKPTNE